MAQLSRRALLGSAGAARRPRPGPGGGWRGARGLAAGAGGGSPLARDGEPAAGAHVVPFHGRHQAGIATPVQDRLHFAAFDVEPGAPRAHLAGLLREWSGAAARMTAGLPAGPVNQELLAPPDDTGEALGLTPARLTVTFGLGPSLFDGRFGLAAQRPAAQRPAALRPLPALP